MIGFAQGLDRAGGESGDVLALAEAQEDEFVAAETGDHVARFSHLLHAFRHPLQQFVADRVPQRIVDMLEAVEVDHHHGERRRAVRMRAVARCSSSRKLVRLKSPVRSSIRAIRSMRRSEALPRRDVLDQQRKAVRRRLEDEFHETRVGEFDVDAVARAALSRPI